VFLGFIISEILLFTRTDRGTDGYGYIDSDSDSDIYTLWGLSRLLLLDT